MGFNHLSAILGATTAAVVSTTLIPSQVARAANFFVDSGVTSVFLDTDILSGVGLNLTGTVGDVAEPASDEFLVGFNITPDTDFSFSDEGGFTLLGGSIEHEGGVVFNSDTPGELAVGNFSIGFDGDRVNDTTGATGFFVQDTLTTGAVLFDVASVVPAADDNSLTINGDLLVSSQLAGVLGNTDLTGANVGAAQVNATTAASVASVPEPVSTAGVLLVGATLVVSRRRNKRLDMPR
ncbi:MAG: PEP-CTERM sorting domain-containing protein [Nostocaceae cyanobacterium]|nr:PEP-CTERM sorting domain-containing protein [Nostocaceae cyanobacterium]